MARSDVIRRPLPRMDPKVAPFPRATSAAGLRRPTASRQRADCLHRPPPGRASPLCKSTLRESTEDVEANPTVAAVLLARYTAGVGDQRCSRGPRRHVRVEAQKALLDAFRRLSTAVPIERLRPTRCLGAAQSETTTTTCSACGTIFRRSTPTIWLVSSRTQLRPSSRLVCESRGRVSISSMLPGRRHRPPNETRSRCRSGALDPEQRPGRRPPSPAHLHLPLLPVHRLPECNTSTLTGISRKVPSPTSRL